MIIKTHHLVLANVVKMVLRYVNFVLYRPTYPQGEGVIVKRIIVTTLDTYGPTS